VKCIPDEDFSLRTFTYYWLSRLDSLSRRLPRETVILR